MGFGCRVSATPVDAPSGDGAADGASSGDTADDDGSTGATTASGGSSSTTSHGGTSADSGGRTSTHETATGGSTATDDSTTSGGSAPLGSANAANTGGSSSHGTGGSAGSANQSAHDDDTAGAPTSGSGSSDPTPLGCDAQSVSFDEIRRGEVRSDVLVRVDATATSQKFLLSHSHSGSCLFAAFVGTAADADGPRGLLIVSYGDDALAEAACATSTDAIPDDLRPGDAVRGVGYLASYAPSGCASTPSPQLMVDRACPLQRSGSGPAVAPFALSLSDADALARGTDAERVLRFAGGLVRLEQVTATRPSEGDGSVGPYGVIALNETELEIHNDLEYGDLALGGPGDPQKSLVYPYPTTFASVTGLVYLDYCTWSLSPRDRCADLAPPSDNCP